TISLEPRRPTATWTRTVDASLSRSDLVADVATGTPPAIARLTRWNNLTVLVGGPLVPDRIGLVLGGGWTGQSETARGSTADSDAAVGSIFTNLLFTPREGDEMRSVAWL